MAKINLTGNSDAPSILEFFDKQNKSILKIGTYEHSGYTKKSFTLQDDEYIIGGKHQKDGYWLTLFDFMVMKIE